MLSSILITASFAPPWAGPQSEAIPAAMQAYGLACELPAVRTVDVEAFCSWSMWRIMKVLIAFTATGSSSYSSMGVANIMYRKFSANVYFALGYMMGRPMEVLWAMVASTGIFAMSRMQASHRCCGFAESSSLKTQLRAPTTATMIAIGCAFTVNVANIALIFSWTSICSWISLEKSLDWASSGNSPTSSRWATSSADARSQRSATGYPR
mmetsp:Transcript_90348/g.256089  ORF Transcript_90348/g.256089 Transcript_90348/m.256089 type:complete len:210 (-) Transcript_90348:327-956(-)